MCEMGPRRSRVKAALSCHPPRHQLPAPDGSQNTSPPLAPLRGKEQSVCPCQPRGDGPPWMAPPATSSLGTGSSARQQLQAAQTPSPKLAPLTEGSSERPAETERVLVVLVPWHGGGSALARLLPAERRCPSQEGCEFAGLEVVAVPRRWHRRSGVPQPQRVPRPAKYKSRDQNIPEFPISRA